jgi:hypothetical protein
LALPAADWAHLTLDLAGFAGGLALLTDEFSPLAVNFPHLTLYLASLSSCFLHLAVNLVHLPQDFSHLSANFMVLASYLANLSANFLHLAVNLAHRSSGVAS